MDDQNQIPPEKRPSFPSPVLIFVFTAIIVAAFVYLLVLRPTPGASNSRQTTDSPAAAH